MAKKSTPCPITVAQFHADPTKGSEIAAKIASEVPVAKKAFSTGSLGYHGTGKVSLMVDGEVVKMQCSVQAVIVGSKTAAKGTAPLADKVKTIS